MLFDTLSIDSVLQAFESTLKIEYRDKETHVVISNAISALESAFKVTLNKSIYEIQTENQLNSDNVTMLLGQITDCCKNLALYVQVAYFNRCIGISLAEVNYLGFAKPNIMQGFKYLQDKDLYEKRENVITPLTTALSNVEMCTIKRLCTILLVLERLGVAEGVAIIAEYLYLGGLVS